MDRDSGVESLPRDANDERESTKHYRLGCDQRKSLWEAKLLARVFQTDVKKCPHCGGQRSVFAWLTKRNSIKRLLHHWQLSSELPSAAPARAPPQTELFAA